MKTIIPILFVLTLLNCSNDSTDYQLKTDISKTFEIKYFNTENQYVFLDSTTVKSNRDYTVFANQNKVENISTELSKTDSFKIRSEYLNPEKGIIVQDYLMDSNVYIDSIINHNTRKIFKNDQINISILGHSNHTIKEVFGNNDSLVLTTKTKFEFDISGTINKKIDNYVMEYLIQDEIFNHYLPAIFKRSINICGKEN